MNLLKFKKRYTIQFRKVRKNNEIINNSKEKWKEVSDSKILEEVSYLQRKYEFDICSLRIKDSSEISKIIIKCRSCKINNIFLEFASRLNADITDIEFY